MRSFALEFYCFAAMSHRVLFFLRLVKVRGGELKLFFVVKVLSDQIGKTNVGFLFSADAWKTTNCRACE